MIRQVVTACAVIGGLLASTASLAESGFVGERRSSTLNSANLEVALTFGLQQVRADVFSEGRLLISLIESSNRAELINYATSTVVYTDKLNNLAESQWQVTNRRSSALGAYCNILVKVSNNTTHELCVVATSQLIDARNADDSKWYVGNFLAAINDVDLLSQLFTAGVAALKSPAQFNLPLLARSVNDENTRNELSFRQVKERPLLANSIRPSRKLHRIEIRSLETPVLISATL